MRRRVRPPVEVELPASLRAFSAEEWSSPSDVSSSPWEEQHARSRWTDARVAWAREHGIEFAELLRREIRERRARASLELSPRGRRGGSGDEEVTGG